MRKTTTVYLSGPMTGLPENNFRGTGVRSFTAPRNVLDQIGHQAVKEWLDAGYRMGEMMDEIKGSAA